MTERPREQSSTALKAVRYGIGGVMVAAGIALLILNPGGFGVDGFALAVGGGLSVLMINWLFRLGVSSDLEREEEERARRYLEVHGHWPDEEAPPPRTRNPRTRPPRTRTPPTRNPPAATQSTSKTSPQDRTGRNPSRS